MLPMKKRTKVRVYEIPVVIEKDEKDCFFAYAPSLQGCYTQGKSLVEAMENIKEAIELHLEDRRATGEPIPRHKPVSLSSVEVKV